MNINNNVPLSFEALEDGLSISFTNEILYCINEGAWETLLAGENTDEVNKGSVISFQHAKSILGSGFIGIFSINKKCNVSGSCSSIIPKNLGEKFMANRLFKELFNNCDALVDASKLELPATQLADSCYDSMFSGCTSLVNAPELPATTLADSCYFYMFSGCTSLVNAPELPATTLASSCYGSMFSNCTSLVNAPELPATTLAQDCYDSMFYGCEKLTNAPALPATTLAKRCYGSMFYNCTKLNYIKMLATDISATSCLDYWVRGVSSTGTFVKSKDATWNVRGVSGVPNGWKIEYDHNYDIGSDISFHIDRIDETLYAKDWMTWDDWVHSKYNTVSAYVLKYEIIINSYSRYPLDINLDNIIKNGGTYYFRHSGGGFD